ncbi:hypothetical protein BDF14DRAFT_1857720 [Spinellus fusiger]|nr:hypothetical protein BDF14DRAFT_1857720 [Spinellus fusiger]
MQNDRPNPTTLQLNNTARQPDISTMSGVPLLTKPPLAGSSSSVLMSDMPPALTQKLSAMSAEELQDLRENNKRMLKNSALINTLPDSGAKLRETVEYIDALLGPLPVTTSHYADGGMSEQENVTQKLKNMRLNEKVNVRQQTVDLVNSTAMGAHGPVANSMMQLGGVVHGSQKSKYNGNAPHSRVQMMSLEEAIQLEGEQSQAKEAYRRRMNPTSASNAEEILSHSMGGMHLDAHDSDSDSDEEIEGDEEEEEDIDMDSLYSSDGAEKEAQDTAYEDTQESCL